MSFIANLYAIFATFPIIPFVVVFLIFKYFVMNNSKDATGWAINITTIFLISANNQERTTNYQTKKTLGVRPSKVRRLNSQKQKKADQKPAF